MSLFCAKCTGPVDPGNSYCQACLVPSAPELACTRCGCGNIACPRVTWQSKEGGGYHLRAECAACGAYLKFVSQGERWATELAGARP